ncbi:MAG: universal stress protein [Bauldia sp.]|nr:universal stress protein [Bauldia sp.]
MTIKSILVHFDIEDPAEARLELAFRLAEKLDATLIGAGACAFEPIVQPDGAFAFATITVQTKDEIRAKLVEMGKRFTEAAAAREVKAEWRHSLDLPSEAISRMARSADLVLSRPNGSRPWDPFRAADVADVVMKSGRPVLVAPPAAKPEIAERAFIAWKDTREARRAVKDAVPILAIAKEVLVASIEEGDDSSAVLADVVAYLGRHGVKARAETFERGPGDTASSLLSVAGDFNADLIVAGAYGHSRFREWAFGGVTRDLLSELPMTQVLLSN